ALRGQVESAANVLALLEGSAINESHRWCDKVQDAYSLRCAPQVHDASRDLLDYADYTVSVELNVATDNPLVLVDDEALVSNGNFHGQPLAFALDTLAMAVSELADISERRVERLVNPNLPDGLPAFLTTDGGLNSGFMIPQYVAASLVSENKVLCHPASVDSIPTSAGQEDHVSMGNAAGLKAWQVLANCERGVAIELLAGAQAVEFLAPLEPGAGVQATRAAVRELSPRLRDDRSLAPDIEAVATAIRDGSIVAAAESRLGALLELGPDETLLVQSGKPVGVFRTHEDAPRVLIANSLLVPKWATWDEFRRLEGEGLTMFGQMTAGSWIYIGSQGILQGTFQTFAAAGEKHFGSPSLAGRTILTAGLGGMGGAQPLAGTMAGAAILCIEVDPSRIERRLETRYLDEATDSLDDALARVRAAAAEKRPLSVGLLGNAADLVPELAARGEDFDFVTDQTAAHD